MIGNICEKDFISFSRTIGNINYTLRTPPQIYAKSFMII